MLAVKGYYEHGHIFLNETPPVNAKTEVIITFLTDEFVDQDKHKRMPGGLKGKVNIPDDFNDPLDDLNEYM